MSKNWWITLILLTRLTSGVAARAQPLAAGAEVPDAPLVAGPSCDGGVVKDDGSVETGWGWVPSVVDGQYVQQYEEADFPSRQLEKVCVCWLRTRTDDEIDFEVVVYDDVDGHPASSPVATVPATATIVPRGVIGQFVEVDLRGAFLPPGRSFIGVRWNPSRDQFFFLCADTSPATPITDVYFIDDRADQWTSVLRTVDPIFRAHHSVLVRATAAPVPPLVLEVPAADRRGLVVLILLIAFAGLVSLRR